jgi:hypothetical protein
MVGMMVGHNNDGQRASHSLRLPAQRAPEAIQLSVDEYRAER